jgi:hypothetical protein
VTRVVRTLGRRIARGIAATPPWAVLAVGCAYSLIYAFPGAMTQDSFDHLREARDGIYTDAHPPAINLLWGTLDYVIAGPFGMFVVQNACFVTGLYLVLRRLFSARAAAWVTTGVYIFPPVMVPFAVIWKDPLMAGFLMLGTAGLLSPRRGSRIAGLVAMAAGTAVRYNAAAATLPLIVLLFEWRPGLVWWKRYALATAAWLVVTFGAFRFNAALEDYKLHLWTSLAAYDITGTIAMVDEDLSDAEIEAQLAGTELQVHHDIQATMRELYLPSDILPIVNHPTKALWYLPINGIAGPPEEQRDAIARAWKDTVTRWPLAYAKHRFSVLAECLGLGGTTAGGAVPRRDYRWPEYVHQLGMGTGWSKLQRRLERLNRTLIRSTPIFAVWMYLVIALVLLPIARHRDALAILLSGLGIETTLLVFAPSLDYRYSHWLVICAILAAILIGVRRFRGPAGAPAT